MEDQIRRRTARCMKLYREWKARGFVAFERYEGITVNMNGQESAEASILRSIAEHFCWNWSFDVMDVTGGDPVLVLFGLRDQFPDRSERVAESWWDLAAMVER